MPRVLIANNARSTLSVAVSSNTQATLTLQTGEGARFPSPVAPEHAYVTLDDGTKVEVCRLIARSGDVLTVLRGMDGTTAQSSFATGTKVEGRINVDTFEHLTGVRAMPRIKWVRAAGNVASYHVYGVTLPTLINSSVAGTLTNSSFRESNERIRQAQANSAQNPIGVRVAQPCVNGTNGYRFLTQFGFATAPNSSHYFIGLVNTTGLHTSVHPPSSVISAIGVGWANGALNSNLSIFRNDASGNAVALDLGSYFTVQTTAWYEFELDCPAGGGRIDYAVRRLDVNSIPSASSYFTTDIPGTSLWLSPHVFGSTMVTSQFLAELGGFYWES
jgi:hypothetical protein